MATAPTNDIAIIATDDQNSNSYYTKLTPRDEIFTSGFQTQFLPYEELNYLFNNHGNWLDYLNDQLSDTTDELQAQITSNDSDITDINTNIDSISEELTTFEEYVGTTSDGTSEFVIGLFDGFYPVGTIYQNYSNSASPNTYLLGGTNSTWVAIAGRVVIGAGTGTDENSTEQTFTAGETGGEYTHTQTTDEMPAHDHDYSGTTSSDGEHTHGIPVYILDDTGYALVADGAGTTSKTAYTNSDGEHTHTYSGTTTSVGSGDAMNNIQPYIVCYVWRRSA